MHFPKENKEHIGYYDIILSKLQNDGHNLSGFNMSKLNKNRTWDLENALNENATILPNAIEVIKLLNEYYDIYPLT